MQTQNENSSLMALRRLHEIEDRRQREADQARANAEKDRLARAEAQVREDRLAREAAERQAAEAFERAQTTRLGRELDAARAEIVHLRGELEKAYLVQATAAAPAGSRGVRTLSWLGIAAGATMLVGALALAAAMQPDDRRVATAESVSTTLKASPRVEVPAPTPIAAEPTPSAEPAPPPKLAPRRRPAARRTPRAGNERPTVRATRDCDPMSDPLCGLPVVSDEATRRRGKRHR